MVRKSLKKTVALMVTAGMLTGCAGQGEDTVSSQAVTQEETQPVQEEVVNKEEKAEEYGVIGQRPVFISTKVNTDESVSPNAASYTLEKDLSNVDNLWQFYLDDKMTDLIARNGFVVREENFLISMREIDII